MNASLSISVNGERHVVRPGATVEDVVTSLGSGPTGIAVARNGTVVPRSAWPTTLLEAGDALEILRVVAGG